ncbi:hypothetical protein LZ318_11940 [Saccharopolyspora indica]|nr:hypothetical protein [Saccharopolyspora indica]
MQTEPPADYVTFNVHQFDETALRLYYGTGGGSGSDPNTAGVFRVNSATNTPQIHSFLVIIRDGNTNVGFYAPRASIRREGEVELSVDAFAFLPLRATFTQPQAGDDLPLFAWIADTIAAPAAPPAEV